MRMWKGAITTSMALALILAPRPARAGIHQVWDPAHFFKAETLLEVDPILQDIDRKFYKDLMVETFPSIPDDLKRLYQEKGKEKFFQDWAAYEGGRIKLNGVLILISAEPRRVEVSIGLDTRRKAFTEADRVELVQHLTGAFSQGSFDKGLVDAVKFVQDRMDKNLSASATQPATQPGAASPTTRPTDSSK